MSLSTRSSPSPPSSPIPTQPLPRLRPLRPLSSTKRPPSRTRGAQGSTPDTPGSRSQLAYFASNSEPASEELDDGGLTSPDFSEVDDLDDDHRRGGGGGGFTGGGAGPGGGGRAGTGGIGFGIGGGGGMARENSSGSKGTGGSGAGEKKEKWGGGEGSRSDTMNGGGGQSGGSGIGNPGLGSESSDHSNGTSTKRAVQSGRGSRVLVEKRGPNHHHQGGNSLRPGMANGGVDSRGNSKRTSLDISSAFQSLSHAWTPEWVLRGNSPLDSPVKEDPPSRPNKGKSVSKIPTPTNQAASDLVISERRVDWRFRLGALPEVCLISGALLLAYYRLRSMNVVPPATQSTDPYASAAHPPLVNALLVFTLSIPIMALVRRPSPSDSPPPQTPTSNHHQHQQSSQRFIQPTASSSYYMVPFTDSRGYRDALVADDGFIHAVGLPVLLASAFTWECYRRGGETNVEGIRPLVDLWRAGSWTSGLGPMTAAPPFSSASLMTSTAGAVVSAAAQIRQAIQLPFSDSNATNSIPTSSSQLGPVLLAARLSLFHLTLLNSVVLIVNLLLARAVPFLQVQHLPRNNTRRFFGAVALYSTISVLVWSGMHGWNAFIYELNHSHPRLLSPLEAGVSTFISQMSLYIVSRFARRGFTLGELSIFSAGGTPLCLEFWRLTRTRWFYHKYPRIPPTFRTPTPLVSFQHALIPGAFFMGFFLSPLLVLSRHIAQKPSHRLRWPEEKERTRKLLALGVFLGCVGLAMGPFGLWEGWQLGGGWLTAWIWITRYVVFGGDGLDGMQRGQVTGWPRYKRLFLTVYWATILFLAVGGWQTRLARARRQPIKSTGVKSKGKGGSSGKEDNAPTNPVVGAESAKEEKRPHVSLNVRRKFFHGLAVVLLVPGIAIDPAFTSIAFSLAFAVFTFAEYARYFALYPIGAPIHVFFNHFIDSKDAGPVILSHFYLLTGCANGVWLEASGVNRYSGVLVLGIGDAMASIVGKRIGRLRWPGSSKTVEGTIAFALSLWVCALLLRLAGVIEPFSSWRFLLASFLSAMLEATSSQNDNLVVPVYLWALLSLLNV